MNVYKELFFEDEPFKIDVITKFKCYKKGIPMKEITKDYRNPRNERKEVRSFTLTYW